MVRIGTTFKWNGKTWRVYGFSATEALIQSGDIKTRIHHDILLKVLADQG